MKVGVIGPRPDTLAPIQDDIKHMENIGKRKEVGEWKRISREFNENPSSVRELYTREDRRMFCGDFCARWGGGRGEGGGGEELHFNEAMKAWLTSR